MPLSLLPRDVAIVTHVALMPQSKKIDDPACGVIYPIYFIRSTTYRTQQLYPEHELFSCSKQVLSGSPPS